jgi:hypothetical protein
MFVDTFHLKDERSLVDVANEIFPIFQITKFEKRESHFYPKGIYYLGRGNTFELRITVEDDIGFDDYGYCLVFGHLDKSPEPRRQVLRTLLGKNYQLCSARGDERNPVREIYSIGPDDKIVAKTEAVKAR